MKSEAPIQIDQLMQLLLLMASNAEQCVRKAVQSLLQRDERLAASVEEQDSVIDQLEKEVDESAIAILALAPLAEDLRFTAMAMKISTELERVGDEATTISRRSIELMKEKPLSMHVDIESLADLVIEMLKSALDAFVYRRAADARSIVPRDKEADRIYKAIYQQMCACMQDDPSLVLPCLHYITIAKSLERIGDHASNIAEQVVYVCEARDIRYE
jgi:phosphate transport system protein